MTTRRRDLLLGIGVAAFALLLLLVVIPIGVDVPKAVRAAVLSPDLWPRVIAGALLLLGILLAVQAGFGEAGEEDWTESGFDPVAAGRLLVTLALLLAYYWLVRRLGMVLASSLAILAFGLFGRTRHPRLLVATALLLPLLLWGFFYKVAGIPLPSGDWVRWP
ncbi:MAG TPA: tripartite tricarboxylate transporter TctB family protein [Rhodospirillales bacterium]|nr:tripartite tricarboxylate transporter TctB family protein [Rhodospirillales bacterium]